MKYLCQKYFICLLLTAFTLCAGCKVLMAQDRIQEQNWIHRLFQSFPPIVPVDSVKVFVIGDVMMHSKQLDKDCTPFLEEIQPRLSGADLSIANLEFPLGGEPYTGYPSFSTPDSYATYIAGLGTNVFLTANNHITDREGKGLARTLDVYSKIDGVKFTGTACKEIPDSTVNPLIINVKGIKIALVNFTYGTNGPRPDPKDSLTIHYMRKDDVGQLMARARRKNADVIIALPHWGDEYVLTHNKAQEDFARWLAEEGADIIIGSHPHVVQDTSSVVTSDGRRVKVVYSLGNAVSNMSAINTRIELAATITIKRNFLKQVSLERLDLDFMWCTLPQMLTDNYRTIFVEDYRGRREDWINKSDYDNMMATLKRVKEKTGIGN